jgi:hypothetical protein
MFHQLSYKQALYIVLYVFLQTGTLSRPALDRLGKGEGETREMVMRMSHLEGTGNLEE